MKIKTIISLLTFGLTFGFSAYFASFYLPETVVDEVVFEDNYTSIKSGSDIVSLFIQDEKNMNDRMTMIAELRHDGSSESESKAIATSQYVSDAFDINVENLPADLQKAWKNHVTAWQNYSEYLNDIKNRQETPNASKLKYYDSEITRTWNVVLKIGKNYDEDVKYFR